METFSIIPRPKVSDPMTEPYRAALHSTSNYIVVGQVGEGNILDNGHRIDGSDLIGSWLDVVRKEAEGCDCLQGIQSCQFLGGGTCSDLVDSSFSKMHEEHLDRIMETFSFFQSPTVSGTGERAALRCLRVSFDSLKTPTNTCCWAPRRCTTYASAP